MLGIKNSRQPQLDNTHQVDPVGASAAAEAAAVAWARVSQRSSNSAASEGVRP